MGGVDWRTRLLKEPPFTVELLPVVVKQHYSDNSSCDTSEINYSITGPVYRFLNEDMERMARGEKATEKYKTVFFWNKKGLEIYQKVQKGAEHTGNESLEDEVDNIYFNAIVVTHQPKPNSNAPESKSDESESESDRMDDD